MKRSLIIILTTLCVSWAALAHEGHEHEAADASPQFAQPLAPEYLHVILNPFPVYGMAAGAFFLLLALLRRGKDTLPSLVWLILMSLVTGVVVYFGEGGYDRLFSTLDEAGRRWLDVHMHRAEELILVFYLVGVSAFAGLLIRRKWPAVARALEWTTLLLAIASAGIGGWVSRAGGQVRHAEFRTSSPPSGEHSHGTSP